MSQPINILIVHPSALFRAGIKYMLRSSFLNQNSFKFYEASVVNTATEIVGTILAYISIIDLDTVVKEAENWKLIFEKQFDITQVIALTGGFDRADFSGYKFGATVSINCSSETFCASVGRVIAVNYDSNGGLLDKKESDGSPVYFSNKSRITKREREILHLIIDNYTSREISKKLFLSERTVETHRYNLLRKMKQVDLQYIQNNNFVPLQEIWQRLKGS